MEKDILAQREKEQSLDSYYRQPATNGAIKDVIDILHNIQCRLDYLEYKGNSAVDRLEKLDNLIYNGNEYISDKLNKIQTEINNINLKLYEKQNNENN
jgi:hypothetical protein